jgi:3-hydroxyacyl-[acyl-carrier-protein] dehydratase
VMIGVSADLADKNLLVYFMGIDGCKFRRKVVPGDIVEMHLTTLRGKPGGKVWKFGGQAFVEGDLAAEAEFTAMMDLGASQGAA